MEDDLPPSRAIEPAGWLALGIGLALATLTELVPLLRVLIGYFVVLVHELGHALAGWLFGHPSIPAFDFTYGGGVTLHQSRSVPIVLVVFALFGVLLWVFRKNPVSRVIVGVVCGAYALLLATGAADVAMIAMGHGGELLFAGLFLHRAVSGRACHHAAERALYAWLGFHVVFHDVRFAWGLATNAFQREMYGEAKGGGHWMDFSQLADVHFGVSLETVAVGFLFLCAVPVVVAPMLAWLRPELLALRERLGEV